MRVRRLDDVRRERLGIEVAHEGRLARGEALRKADRERGRGMDPRLRGMTNGVDEGSGKIFPPSPRP